MAEENPAVPVPETETTREETNAEGSVFGNTDFKCTGCFSYRKVKAANVKDISISLSLKDEQIIKLEGYHQKKISKGGEDPSIVVVYQHKERDEKKGVEKEMDVKEGMEKLDILATPPRFPNTSSWDMETTTADPTPCVIM